MRTHIVILTLSILFCCIIRPAMAVDNPIDIFYVGPEGSVPTSLSLSESFRNVLKPENADPRRNRSKHGRQQRTGRKSVFTDPLGASYWRW